MPMLVDIVTEKLGWCAVLAQMGGYDFAHTFDFHRASQQNGEGVPLMFVARNSAGVPMAIWPVLQRGISGTEFFDFTSVYGHAGPLICNNVDCQLALNSIWESMRSYGAISLFSRMHPLFVDQISDESLRGRRLSDVVVIDVKSVDDVLQGYRGSHRREIIKARQSGVSLVVDSEFRCLKDFVEIYRQSMSDLHASDYYHFSDAYFESLKNSSDFKSMLVFAELDGAKIAASMFVVTGKVMQYYLSGTVAEFRRLAPSKAIIARAHELAIELDVESFVLGGGVGSARDALFEFKAGFSTLTKPFYIERKVLNERVYSRLCADRAIDSDRISFFPAYRA